MIIEVLKKPCQGHLCPVFVASFLENFLVKVTFGKLTWVLSLHLQGIGMTEGGADDGGRAAWKALKAVVLVLVW